MDHERLRQAIDGARENQDSNPIARYFYGLRQRRIEKAWQSCVAGGSDTVRNKKILVKYDIQSLAFIETQMRTSKSAAINLGFDAILRLVSSGREHDSSLGWNILGVYQEHSELHSDTRNAYVLALAARVERLKELRLFGEKVLENLKADQRPANTRVDDVNAADRATPRETQVPSNGQIKKESSSLLEFLDKSKGTGDLYEMLRTRSAAEVEEVCRTFPIENIRLNWGSIGADAKAGDMHAILSEIGSEAGMRDIKRFELVTNMAQVLVNYEEILKKSPHLLLPMSFPAARCAEILMSRLMPFIRIQKAGEVTQTLRVRLYDFAISLMQAGGGRGDWHDRAALDCLLVSRPSLAVDHEFWIFACRFNIALASKNPDDVAAAAENAEQIVSGEIEVPEQYVEGAKNMLRDLKGKT